MTRRAVHLFAAVLGMMFVAHVVSAQQPAPAAPAAPAGPAPHIKFDSAEANLGDVVHGKDAVATFTYHNTGDAPLHILSAKPG
jgi:hypothetical protein